MKTNEKVSQALRRVSNTVMECPDNDQSYFNNNVDRYFFTFNQFFKSTPQGPILDIGCHYLHSAMILALLGFDVTGLDIAQFIRKGSVVKRAEMYHITLAETSGLGDSGCLGAFESNSFNIVFFTEILEHLTFNPIDMWKEIYRVLRPGGTIYLTTPNYYFLPNQIRRLKQGFLRKGGGIPIADIFSNVTYGHHWKEYAVKEISEYFSMLSLDFHVNKIVLFNPYGYPVKSLKRVFLYLLGIIISDLQKGMYAEIRLESKKQGIQIQTPLC